MKNIVPPDKIPKDNQIKVTLAETQALLDKLKTDYNKYVPNKDSKMTAEEFLMCQLTERFMTQLYHIVKTKLKILLLNLRINNPEYYFISN